MPNDLARVRNRLASARTSIIKLLNDNVVRARRHRSFTRGIVYDLERMMDRADAELKSNHDKCAPRWRDESHPPLPADDDPPDHHPV